MSALAHTLSNAGKSSMLEGSSKHWNADKQQPRSFNMLKTFQGISGMLPTIVASFCKSIRTSTTVKRSCVSGRAVSAGKTSELIKSMLRNNLSASDPSIVLTIARKGSNRS